MPIYTSSSADYCPHCGVFVRFEEARLDCGIVGTTENKLVSLSAVLCPACEQPIIAADIGSYEDFGSDFVVRQAYILWP